MCWLSCSAGCRYIHQGWLSSSEVLVQKDLGGDRIPSPWASMGWRHLQRSTLIDIGV